MRLTSSPRGSDRSSETNKQQNNKIQTRNPTSSGLERKRVFGWARLFFLRFILLNKKKRESKETFQSFLYDWRFFCATVMVPAALMECKTIIRKRDLYKCISAVSLFLWGGEKENKKKIKKKRRPRRYLMLFVPFDLYALGFGIDATRYFRKCRT